MDAVAYIRVSSRAQDHASQKVAIAKLAAARGDTVVRWHAEKQSGKSIERDALRQLRQEVRAGVVHRLYVFRLDRLARSGIRDTFEIVEECRAHGTELVSVADGFDLNGPAAEVVLAVLAWAAKMERLAINERISAARDRMETEGRSWGRPPRLNEADRERIRSLKEEGRSVRAISMALKVPRSTVARALSQNVGHAKGAGGAPGGIAAHEQTGAVQ
jgi:DNA invertase Pin-like site-specific DNA recombinase